MNLPKGLAKKRAATRFMSPKGMATRPPVIDNKARGTMSSSTHSPIPNSVSGMGQSGMAAQGTPSQMPMGGIAQPQGSFTGPAGVGPKRKA